MALTESNMLPLGTLAPAFHLPDTISDNEISLAEIAKGKQGVVVMFICNHCPYVIHVNDGIVSIARDYQPQNIGFVAISSNDVANYPDDSPEMMKVHAAKYGYTFPYLYDESQDTARRYDAACTPDFYVFDKDLKLVYRGRMDDSRPSNGKPVTGYELRDVLDRVLKDEPISETQYPSAGCNIKWKK